MYSLLYHVERVENSLFENVTDYSVKKRFHNKKVFSSLNRRGLKQQNLVCISPAQMSLPDQTDPSSSSFQTFNPFARNYDRFPAPDQMSDCCCDGIPSGRTFVWPTISKNINQSYHASLKNKFNEATLLQISNWINQFGSWSRCLIWRWWTASDPKLVPSFSFRTFVFSF